MEGMVNTIEADYLILGGGLSGIGAAHGLKKNNFILIEKSKRLLGHEKSFKFKDYYFDSGTHICLSIDKKWLDKLNLEDALYFDNSDVKNYDESNWIGYPVQNNLKDIMLSDAQGELQTYYPMPIETSGWEMKGDGSLPRPKLLMANPQGV